MGIESALAKVLIGGICAAALVVLLFSISLVIYVQSGGSVQQFVRQTGPDALWASVHYVCVPTKRWLGVSLPCTFVDVRNGEQNGYAVLRDIRGYQRYLVTPTQWISGIESSVLLNAGTPNYFAYAWQSRSFLEKRVRQTLPRDEIALAVNPPSNRSQDHLHIHIGCIKPEVRAALREHQSEIGPSWTPFPTPLVGSTYQAIRINAEDLDRINPFKVLADGLPGAKARMGSYTLAAVGATFADGTAGFILLASDSDLSQAEALLADDYPPEN
jgi:CDP-diacylglycerol pyrophosphatase